MNSSQNDGDNCIGRRRFLTSIFGLRAASQTEAAANPEGKSQAKPAQQARTSLRKGAIFIWSDLKTGQIGFPTGLDLGSGQPGSLMKLIAASAFLEEGLINPNHAVECDGHVSEHKNTFHCQKAHGKVNLVEAIAKSCNVYFVEAARKLRTETFLTYARKFGLDQGVAGRQSGPFPEHAHGPSFNYVLGLAPDLSPNALQILRISALIALKGSIPDLHSAEAPGHGQPPLSLVLQPGTWSHLREGMQLGARIGTSQKLDPQNTLFVAAKTGTAPHGKLFQSWVTGFFPFESPKYAFVVYAPSGTSQDAAVPKAHEFLLANTWP